MKIKIPNDWNPEAYSHKPSPFPGQISEYECDDPSEHTPSSEPHFSEWDSDSKNEFAALLDTAEQIFRLQSQVTSLQIRLTNLEQVTTDGREPFALFSSSLGAPGIKVEKPIPISVRCDGDEFVATWFDANISTGGATAHEAISRLHSLISDIFEDIMTRSEDSLGKSMKKQRRVLLESLCQTS